MCSPVLMHAPVYLQLSHTLENIYTTELLKAMPTNVLYTENDLIWPHKPLFCNLDFSYGKKLNWRIVLFAWITSSGSEASRNDRLLIIHNKSALSRCALASYTIIDAIHSYFA